MIFLLDCFKISSFPQSSKRFYPIYSFTDEAPAQKEEISLTLHLDSEAFPTVEISLYRYDGSSCLAVVDGVPTALVERSQVVDLIEAVNSIVLN